MQALQKERVRRAMHDTSIPMKASGDNMTAVKIFPHSEMQLPARSLFDVPIPMKQQMHSRLLTPASSKDGIPNTISCNNARTREAKIRLLVKRSVSSLSCKLGHPAKFHH